MNQISVLCPYDNHEIKKLPLATSYEVESAISLAFETHNNRDERLSKYERIKILQKVIHKMMAQKEEIIKIAVEEGGKPWVDSKIEVERAIQGIHIAINEIETQDGRKIPMGHTRSSENRLAFTIQEPRGVVLSISAFNHPINLIIHQVVPAIAAGCPVIIKPASATPLSCFYFVNILYNSGLPKKWCQAILCSRENTEKLVEDPRISFFSFIGSAKVGWRLKSKLAPGVVCALEHGGAAPVIIEKDADIETLIPSILKGGFYHAGQVCVSVQRVYIHESTLLKILPQLKEKVMTLKVGDPMDKSTEVGPLISPKEVDRVEQWVNEAREGNAEIVCGGKRISDTYYEPTIILNPDENALVSKKEIFGPVVCVYSYKDRLEAIKRANSAPFSFQAAIFTREINTAIDSVHRLKAEAVMVNDHSAFRVDWMPFGGSEESGISMGGIGYSIKDMTKEKLVVIKTSQN